jgi:hypothetical protein
MHLIKIIIFFQKIKNYMNQKEDFDEKIHICSIIVFIGFPVDCLLLSHN